MPARHNQKDSFLLLASCGLSRNVGEKRLVENQVKILIIVKRNPKTSKKELAESLKISTTAIDKNIAKLKTLNVLKRVGPAKGGYWEIVD
ncbi:MAG: HTH domain-containing protein [Candidatus Electrothrix sp. AR5]|nr:HTH domain-containing protein [Candidatus Electrothrix sp. AR5]